MALGGAMFVCCSLILLALSSAKTESYVAAVFQHTRIKIEGNATGTKMANVQAYAAAIADAQRANVDIIVFPEVGLGSNEIDRALNVPYCEDIPDPEDEIVPCKRSVAYCKSRY